MYNNNNNNIDVSRVSLQFMNIFAYIIQIKRVCSPCEMDISFLQGY